jgi:hypothetical protein
MSTLQTIHGRLVDLHRYLGPTVRGYEFLIAVDLDNFSQTPRTEMALKKHGKKPQVQQV